MKNSRLSQKKRLRKKLAQFILIIFIIIHLFISITIILQRTNYFSFHDSKIPQNEIRNSNSNFDALNFWEKEIIRVNNTDLNILYGKNRTLEYVSPLSGLQKNCVINEITFDSPNWVNVTPSIIRLHGYLLYPETVESKNPGCLCMHGLGNQANKSFDLAYLYLEKGFIVLCHSHPGHGLSEGAKPSSNNFYYNGDFNQSSHNYLTICGAIQGLRVLENHTLVNNSQIMVTGTSYGGLNTMWLSGICGERILAVNPIIAVGENRQLTKDPTKLLFWIWDVNPSNVPDSFWDNQNLRIDPIYYLTAPEMPPIFWIIGTNDEFFDYRSIEPTFNAANTTKKYLQIHPNGHHVIFDYQETLAFFIDMSLNLTQASPNIILNDAKLVSDIIGSNVNLNISTSNGLNVKSVQVGYKYVDLIGVGWETIELTKTGNNTWIGSIPPSIFTSNMEYFIIINIDGNNVWFTSNIINGGVLTNNFSLFLYIIFILLSVLPIILIIWRRYHKNFRRMKEHTKNKARKYYVIEILSIVGLEIVFFISLLLPLTNFGDSGVSWSTIHLFNHIFTWRQIFGVLAVIFVPIFFLIFILNSYLCYLTPILASVFKFIYFIFMLLVYLIFYNLIAGSAQLSKFGAITLGIGFYLVLIESIGLFVVGIFKRKYLAKFQLRTPKDKFYNIDRWFRIKSK